MGEYKNIMRKNEWHLVAICFNPTPPLSSLSEQAIHSNENLYSFIMMMLILQNNKDRL